MLEEWGSETSREDHLGDTGVGEYGNEHSGYTRTDARQFLVELFQELSYVK